MILGVGSDLCDIRRIERALVRHGERFTRRCFTAQEVARAERRPHDRASTYAKRFAAKEACSKALGTGLKRGVHLSTMGVTNLPSGAPTMMLSGGALARLQAMTPAGLRAIIHVSLTDEYPLAQAFVVIEARPAAEEARA